jgi:hypothetical protein
MKMPYSYPSKVPKVAMHWTDPQQKKCVAAANAVLNRGGSDEDAVFACIHAAGHSHHKQGDDDHKYDQMTEKTFMRYQELARQVISGALSIAAYRDIMHGELKELYTGAMLLGLDGNREPSREDLTWLNKRLDAQYDYLDGFIEDMRGGYSEKRAMWRAGLYAFPRAAYMNFKLEPDISAAMPVLPGDDCLGGSLCKCSLEVEVNSDGDVMVHWLLDPTSESCAVCVAHATESPFIFTVGDLRG